MNLGLRDNTLAKQLIMDHSEHLHGEPVSGGKHGSTVEWVVHDRKGRHVPACMHPMA